jgi:RimJ/RimL family protein N-acetyltransferase
MTHAPSSSPWLAAVPLETRRLVLRAFAFPDVPRIARYAGDLAVSRMLARVPHPYTEAHASAFIGDMLASNVTGDGLGLAIARKKEPGALIGSISFTRAGASAEIGWWLGPPYWARGLATEAVAAMVGLAFRDETLEKLTAGAFAGNAASLRVQEKLGFAQVGAGERESLARGGLAAHVETELTRAAFLSR